MIALYYNGTEGGLVDHSDMAAELYKRLYAWHSLVGRWLAVDFNVLLAEIGRSPTKLSGGEIGIDDRDMVLRLELALDSERYHDIFVPGESLSMRRSDGKPVVLAELGALSDACWNAFGQEKS